VPEAPEVDTDRLHEQIQEEVERDSGASLKAIALTTALFAALAAVAALRAAGTVNEALALKAEATRLQAEASDQWAAYQAKGIKDEILSFSNSPDKTTRSAKYKSEQAQIQAGARESEASSHAHLEHHAILARAVTLFQISIAISAIAILTKKRLLWYVSLGISCFGIFFFITGIF